MNYDEFNEIIQTKLASELGEEILSALKDRNVLEVMVNPDGTCWVDTFDGMKPFHTMSGRKTDVIIRTVATACHTTVTLDNPEIGCELVMKIDGKQLRFRFQGVVPPMASPNPCFNIRKHATQVFTLDDYLRERIITKRQLTIIEKAIAEYRNFLIVGATSSGKTTFGNSLLDAIARITPDDRIFILEQIPELESKAVNSVYLQTTPNRTMNDLLRATLHMRPSRIIIGELLDRVAHDLLKAWNTGHPGGFTTLHADSAIRGLRRLEQLVEEANVPVNPSLIAESIDTIIFIAPSPKTKARRMVMEILAVDGYDTDSRRYVTRVLAQHPDFNIR